MTLEERFSARVWAAIEEARDLGYYLGEFIKMVESSGAVSTAKQLVVSADIQSGLKRLGSLNSLHLSIEFIMLQDECRELFRPDEISAAEWRLKEARAGVSDDRVRETNIFRQLQEQRARKMNSEWILQRYETCRRFANSTWVPLRASVSDEVGRITDVDYRKDFFGCGSVAFPPQRRELADRLSWSHIGIIHSAQPHVHSDGTYSSIDQYRHHGDEVVGVELVFEHRQPVIGGTKWILNPDLIVALRLVKEGDNWVRPEEDFVVVARERLDEKGSHRLMEIKREFLMDYLAARNLSLRISYYRQRVINVAASDEGNWPMRWRSIFINGCTSRTTQARCSSGTGPRTKTRSR